MLLFAKTVSVDTFMRISCIINAELCNEETIESENSTYFSHVGRGSDLLSVTEINRRRGYLNTWCGM